MLRVQPGRWPGSLAIDHPLGPLRIEPQQPVPDYLQTDTVDTGGFATSAAVPDHRERQQQVCLICIPRIPRQVTQLGSREVRAECCRCRHDEYPLFAMSLRLIVEKALLATDGAPDPFPSDPCTE
jgi:hypothetical protein